MSIRRQPRSDAPTESNALRLQEQLVELKKQNALIEASLNASSATAQIGANASVSSESIAAYEQLTPVEQSVASLGVHPDALSPIGWINTAYHAHLQEQNALAPDLARRIAAYSHVASQN